MPEVSATSAQIVELCSKSDFDPYAVLGLLSLHALADGDMARLGFLNMVTDKLRNSLTLDG
jgi:hypothetical protein